ncbi:MAG: DUF2007 domain-containing protein [SAR202 cluster bacterium]|nr:DUF2007 domain-containing protein [SAR202 cluster bacterium]
MSRRERRKQVSLTVFDNEPTARMAEQRLQEEGIPCLVRSLRGGPGLWGSAYNLPHELLVNEDDEMRARDILGFPPKEIMERERQGQTTSAPTPPATMSQWIIMGAIIVIVTVVVLAVVVGNRAIH